MSEAMALIQQAVRAGTVSAKDLSRLHLLGLVEQPGMSIGLTAMGVRTIARLSSGSSEGSPTRCSGAA
jgi:hypothetical protein